MGDYRSTREYQLDLSTMTSGSHTSVSFLSTPDEHGERGDLGTVILENAVFVALMEKLGFSEPSLVHRKPKIYRASMRGPSKVPVRSGER